MRNCLPYVALKLPDSRLDSSDDCVLVNKNIMCQTTAAVRQGIPLRYLFIIGAAEEGTRTESSTSQVYLPAVLARDAWDRPAKVVPDRVIAH